jgi:hypothetical protein
LDVYYGYGGIWQHGGIGKLFSTILKYFKKNGKKVEESAGEIRLN